jgi:FMN phosphatase YigB (HAD superfamily)
MASRHLDAVMVDLDHTLFDADAPRDGAARIALGRFLPAAAVEDALTVYNQVVSQWRLFVELGYGNFRQVYDLPANLAIALALFESARSDPRQLWADWTALTTRLADAVARRRAGVVAPRTLDRIETAASRQALRSAAGGRFAAAIADAVHRLTEAVGPATLAEAAAGLNPIRYEARPYEDAASFFEAVSGHRLIYIVTEGDDSTQWQKVQTLGLDRYVSYDHLLSSYAAADPLGVQAELAGLTTLVEMVSEAPEAGTALIGDHDSGRDLGHFLTVRGAHDDGQIDRHLDELRQALGFLRRWLARFRTKVDQVFYARALQAIVAEPAAPRRALEGLRYPSQAEWTASGLRVAMVGDRFETDVYPLTSQFGDGVLTVRLRRGKYRDSFTEPPPELAPTLATTSLDAAAAWLAEDGNWAGLEPIRYPRVAERSDLRELSVVLRVTADLPEQSVVRRLGNLLATARWGGGAARRTTSKQAMGANS